MSQYHHLWSSCDQAGSRVWLSTQPVGGGRVRPSTQPAEVDRERPSTQAVLPSTQPVERYHSGVCCLCVRVTHDGCVTPPPLSGSIWFCVFLCELAACKSVWEIRCVFVKWLAYQQPCVSITLIYCWCSSSTFRKSEALFYFWRKGHGFTGVEIVTDVHSYTAGLHHFRRRTSSMTHNVYAHQQNVSECLNLLCCCGNQAERGRWEEVVLLL